MVRATFSLEKSLNLIQYFIISRAISMRRFNSFGLCLRSKVHTSESKAYTLSEGRLELLLSFPDSTLAVAALIDIGAAGFMRRDVAEKLWLTIHQRPRLNLFLGLLPRSFDRKQVTLTLQWEPWNLKLCF